MKVTTLFIVLFLVVPVFGVIVTIDADDFIAGTSVSSAFDYITLSGSDGSDICSVASTNIGGELGANVLGCGLDENWRFGPYNDYDYLGEYLIIDIDGFATNVSAWYAATDDRMINHCVMMLGFDSDDIQFAISVGARIDWRDGFAGVGFSTGESRPFTRVVVGMIEGWAVSLDHITIDYTPIPEPATIVLLCLGGLIAFRRK